MGRPAVVWSHLIAEVSFNTIACPINCQALYSTLQVANPRYNFCLRVIICLKMLNSWRGRWSNYICSGCLFDGSRIIAETKIFSWVVRVLPVDSFEKCQRGGTIARSKSQTRIRATSKGNNKRGSTSRPNRVSKVPAPNKPQVNMARGSVVTPPLQGPKMCRKDR